MRVGIAVAVVCGALALPGCGSDKPALNTAPLTDAEKAAIKAQDQRTDDEEKSGSGSAVKGKKGK